MRKITIISMISMDGVMQAPGGREEDTSGNFQLGGWTAPYSDEDFNRSMMEELQQPVDYLLGRKTFDIWEGYWPDHGDFWPRINEGTKYTFSNTRHSSDWQHSVFLKDVADIEQLKQSDGPDIQVWGSSKLIQLLLQHNLADELRLKIYPLILGSGKRLFAEGAAPAAYILTASSVTAKGVIIASYQRAGAVETGDVGA